MKRDVKICLENFKKFYDLLMKDAKEDYKPWLFACEKNGKNPAFERIKKKSPVKNSSWKHDGARLTKEECIEHIKEGYNLGISARSEDPLIIIDIDDEKYLEQLPEETLTATSRKRAGAHAFGWDKDGTAKINIPTDDGEVRSSDMYVLACGSFVAFDMTSVKDKKAYDKLPQYARDDKLIGHYTLRDANTPKELCYDDLPELFKERDKLLVEAEAEAEQREERKTYENKEGKYTQLFNLKVSDITGKIPSTKRVGHPLHDSDTNANWSLSNDGAVGNCWRCSVSLNAVQYLCVKVGYSECALAGTPHARKDKNGNRISQGKSKIRGDKEALEIAYNEAVKLGLIEEYKGKTTKRERKGNILLDRISQVGLFSEENPFFYDKNNLWWKWNKDKFKYEKSDEVEILGVSYDEDGSNIVASKERTEIVNALKHIGRERIPKDAAVTWVQFKEVIHDFKTGEEFEASPEYFVTNPIAFKPGKTEDTPIIDKLFKEWVGEEYAQTLLEVTAYTASSYQFMQRIIALVGGGSNGKGTYLKLLTRLLGRENVCTSELRELSNNQFETAVVYKKLLCNMGEVSQDDLKNTNQIKKLSGEDDIRFCFKGKTPFTESSVTTLINSTNSLPTTPDKTMGFYRRWLIIDFPNQFPKIKEGLIEKIPDEEFENLAKKVLRILKELYETETFTNEGDFQKRMERYEERSNPVGRFIETHCEEELGSNYVLKDFSKEFNIFAKKNHVTRLTVRQVGKALREEGETITSRTRKIDDITQSSEKVILNLRPKSCVKLPELPELPKKLLDTHIEPSNNSGSSGSSGSSQQGIYPDVDEFFEIIKRVKK